MGKFLVAAKAIIAVKNRVLILKKADKGNGIRWDLPGGKVHFGETLEEALTRQVKEETGCHVSIVKPYKFWSFLQGEDTQIIGTTFLCRSTDIDNINLSDEHSDYEWIYQDEVDSYEFLGNIKNELKECFMNMNIN